MASVSLFQVGVFVSFLDVLKYLFFLLLFIISIEKTLHVVEHFTIKYSKYHDMINKVYRELMILGLVGLVLKIIKELGLVDAYEKGMIAFQIADLMIFLLAIALLFQAIVIFVSLRKRNMALDQMELLSSTDLLHD